MQKLILGLDIGVSSVGWGIIDQDTEKIVDCGVRIFPQSINKDNILRRTMRGNKRTLRRKRHRLERVQKALEGICVFCPDYKEYSNTNPYELRAKGLTERLTKEELYIAVMHLTKRRGISYLEDLELDKENKVDNETIKKNLELSKNQYICQIQLEKLKQNGSIRGHENVFETRRYVEELEQILKTQAKYYEEIDDEFINQLIEIIKSKREYFDGPGSEKSRTDYGRFKTNGETLDNLFEILIGKCSIFPNEIRCPRASYKAQLFNFLNDLNNIKINNNKLTKEQKEQIYKIVIESKTVNMMKIISKVTKTEERLIEGYRKSPEGKPEFHRFEIYKKFVKQLEKKEMDTSKISNEDYNEISYVLTLETSKARKRKVLLEKVPHLGEEIIEAICEIDSSDFKGWHSLSYKAIDEILDDLWNTSKEQHTLFLEHHLVKPNKDIYEGKKNIPTYFIDEEVMNPIARRSIRQSINIINTIRARYGELDSIIIEMAREFTTDLREIEKEQQRNFEKKREAAALTEPYGYTYNSIPGELLTMLQLWLDQEGRCIYSHKVIGINDLINNYAMFQIDHIIPKSISFDDGYNNKVLCYKEENQKKGKRTPYYYLSNTEGNISYQEYKDYIINLNQKVLINNRKKELLLFEKDITKYEVRQGFINRNLQDTRYSTKQVLNILQDYMRANKINTKIFTVKGAYTSKIRSAWKIKKDRLYYKHHAIDALIIAASNHIKFYPNNSFYQGIYNALNRDINDKEAKILSDEEYDSLVYGEPYPKFIETLKSLEPKISHKVDKKINRGISDQTIKSSRIFEGEEYVISKLSNIYDKDGEKLKDKILNHPESLLIYHHDKKSFEMLQKIAEDYYEYKNPFLEYYKEHGKIRKVFKNNEKAPFITSIKYMEKKLGKHLSITHKYENPKNNVFLLSIKPYRIDVYKNEKGIYKFISVTYSMFHFNKEELELKEEEIQLAKDKKKVTEDYHFCFSLYTGDCFEIQMKGEMYQYVLLGVSSDSRNQIECNYIERKKEAKEQERIFISIGKNIEEFRKYHTDILGNKYYCKEKNEKILTKLS